jgi:hypothetical protein
LPELNKFKIKKNKKMSQVNTLLESAAGSWKNMQSDAAKLAGKWAKTGLLEGLDEMNKNNMSLLLENQAKQLVTETNTITTNSSFTSGTDGENWAGIALPLVRKVFGSIVAKEFVSVQPMNLPSGLVFFLDFQYGNAKDPFAVGDSLYGDRNNVPGARFPFATPAAEGGLYGAGRFAYSTNQFSASYATGSTAVATLDVATDQQETNFEYSASMAAGEIHKVTVALPANADEDGVRAFYLNGTDIAPANTLAELTKVVGTDVVFFTTGSTAPKGTLDLAFNIDTADDRRGDFEADGAISVPNSASAAQIVIPEINVRMQSQAITAKTKKLKAVWTPEFAQDLAAYQNIDAEAELTNIMSEYISMEIDLEILDMLISDAAAGTEYWTAKNNGVYDGAGGFDFPTSTSQTGFYNSQGEWFQTLGTKMQKLSNKIHQLTLRGGANFLVTSPTVATILESIPGFASNSNGDAAQGEYAFGVQKIGTINNRYKVYKNPYFTDNLILMGYRGSQFLETGAVFAPYIPLIMTPLVYDPDTFTPRKGLMTRYAKKMLRPEYYGKIYVAGLETI